MGFASPEPFRGGRMVPWSDALRRHPLEVYTQSPYVNSGNLIFRVGPMAISERSHIPAILSRVFQTPLVEHPLRKISV